MEFILRQNNQNFYKVPAVGLQWKHLGLTPFVYNNKAIQENPDLLQHVKEFYLNEKDFIAYSESVVNNSHDKNQTKIIVASFGMETIMIRIKSEGFSQEIFEMYKQVILQMKDIQFDPSFKDYVRQMLASPKVKYFLLRAVLCKSLAINLGWTSNKMIEDVLMASLFCDLGAEIDNNPGIYHGEYLASMMANNRKIADSVTQGILHHHEYNNGSGPLGLKRYKISPIAKIIRTVEDCLDLIKNKQQIGELFRESSKNKLDPIIVDRCLELFSQTLRS